MNDPMYGIYAQENMDYWLEQKPFDVLISCCSDARRYIEVFGDVGFGVKYTASLSFTGEEIIFDTEPPISFSQVAANLAKNVLALHHLIVIACRYFRPAEQRYWDAPEDFDFEINITDDFDSPAFALTHHQLPPLSMLFAISKSLIDHAAETDFCFKLLAEPGVKERIQFNVNSKPLPYSKLADDLVEHNRIFTLIGQNGINYVNAKRAENED